MKHKRFACAYGVITMLANYRNLRYSLVCHFLFSGFDWKKWGWGWFAHRWHDDVIKWKHFPRYWRFVRGIHQSPVNSPHKGHWRRALMFSLICFWINGWVNNREADDLRRYRAHYDVIVMVWVWSVTMPNHPSGDVLTLLTLTNHPIYIYIFIKAYTFCGQRMQCA